MAAIMIITPIISSMAARSWVGLRKLGEVKSIRAKTPTVIKIKPPTKKPMKLLSDFSCFSLFFAPSCFSCVSAFSGFAGGDVDGWLGVPPLNGAPQFWQMVTFSSTLLPHLGQ